MRKQKQKRKGSIKKISIIGFVLALALTVILKQGLAFSDSEFLSLQKLADLASHHQSSYPNPNTDAPRNFQEAKVFAKEIYADHRVTFYCGCRFNEQGRIDLPSCGYKIQRDLERAHRLEWEHIVPISQIASHLSCWQKKECRKANGAPYKGRACCREIDPTFAIMEADLHNLVPEIGELNGCRSNFRFGMLPYIESGQFGECHFKIDKEHRRVEPRHEVRGMIARIYLYVAERYGVHLSDSQLQLFKAWSKEYPPDAFEIERDKRIAKIQGNHNPYVTGYHYP